MNPSDYADTPADDDGDGDGNGSTAPTGMGHTIDEDTAPDVDATGGPTNLTASNLADRLLATDPAEPPTAQRGDLGLTANPEQHVELGLKKMGLDAGRLPAVGHLLLGGAMFISGLDLGDDDDDGGQGQEADVLGGGFDE